MEQEDLPYQEAAAGLFLEEPVELLSQVVQAELLSLVEAADLLSQAVPVEHHDPAEAADLL